MIKFTVEIALWRMLHQAEEKDRMIEMATCLCHNHNMKQFNTLQIE